ncbi:hypothetical protein ACODT5_16270 [Streptomyces sp. 5.8]|uniref:hypothetical protein n=1 Tax=Streptomyces sp. 5.8 TaxID=3406571 RepID=UPI003BB68FD8
MTLDRDQGLSSTDNTDSSGGSGGTVETSARASTGAPTRTGLTTDAARLYVGHFAPLAEIFDSERAPWSAARREAYANDQNSSAALIAVSAASNRSKSDKDPAQWLPSDGSDHCSYAASWVGTKLRWDLAADEAEVQALLGVAEDCPTTTVVYETAA